MDKECFLVFLVSLNDWAGNATYALITTILDNLGIGILLPLVICVGFRTHSSPFCGDEQFENGGVQFIVPSFELSVEP